MSRMSFSQCSEISRLCPVEATVYGYYPNLGGNVFFLISFTIVVVGQLYLGIRHRTWSWLGAMFVGCTLEVIGYGGRIMMHRNPWTDIGFRMQVASLIIAPSFISGSIDLVLKHVVLTFGNEYSRIPARWYTWGFIGADIFAIALQAVGGALATASKQPSMFRTGNNMMLAGIILQVVQLVAFGLVTAEYAFRTFRHRAELQSGIMLDVQAIKKFKLFAISCTVAYITILTRCVYRIPELAQGWGGALMRDEPTFLILDGAMVLVASIVLTVFHPGIFFPQLATSDKSGVKATDDEKRGNDREVSSTENSDGILRTGDDRNL